MSEHPLTADLLKLLGSVAVAAVFAMAYVFSTFETKADAQGEQNALEKRLIRIEDKVDRLLASP